MDFLIRPGHHRPWVATNRELSRKELGNYDLKPSGVFKSISEGFKNLNIIQDGNYIIIIKNLRLYPYK